MWISEERKNDLWVLFIGTVIVVVITSFFYTIHYMSRAPDRQCDAIEARCDEGKELACTRFKTECLKEK